MRFGVVTRHGILVLIVLLIMVSALPLCLAHSHESHGDSDHLCANFGPLIVPAPVPLLVEAGATSLVRAVIYRADPADLPAPPPKA